MPDKTHIPICDMTHGQFAAYRFVGKTYDGIYGWRTHDNPLRLELGDEADYTRWLKMHGITPALDHAEMHVMSDTELRRLGLILSDLVMDNGRKRSADLLADGRRILDAIRERKV